MSDLTPANASEGDANLSPLRATWRAKLGGATKALLDADAKAFLHQSLSTPCLDVIDRADGAVLTDTDGNVFSTSTATAVTKLVIGTPK